MVAELTGVIDQLVATEATALGEGDTVLDLIRQLSRLEAVVAGAVTAFDASGAYGLDGAKTAVAWISTKSGLPRPAVKKLARRGKGAACLGRFAQAWAQGSLSGDYLDVVLSVRRPTSEAALARDEALLVKKAQELRFEDFCRVVAYWDQLADPDGTEAAAQERRLRRDVYLTPSVSGMYLGQMTLDAISGAIVSGELGRLEDEFFCADWERARTELGRDPKAGDLWRTPAQRRADALVEMATRSAGAGEGARRPAPLFSVLVGWETLAGRVLELANGVVLTPGALVPWLEEADFERAVFGPERRVEVSATARFFTGGLRRAIELRDRQCQHAFCDVRAEYCQCDHIVPYGEGGPTTQENGRMLCGFHNRQRNHERPPPPDD
jgi:hypothetical protein